MRYRLLEAFEYDTGGPFAFLLREDEPLPRWPNVTFAQVTSVESLEEGLQAFRALQNRLEDARVANPS